MKWILIFMILLGDWLIIEKDRDGFYCWIFADGCLAFNNFFFRDYLHGIIFALYAFMGIYGLYSWV